MSTSAMHERTESETLDQRAMRAQAFDRMYYLERAAMTYLTVLSTGRPLRRLSHEVAKKTAHQLASYPGQGERHLEEIKLILDREQSDFRS